MFLEAVDWDENEWMRTSLNYGREEVWPSQTTTKGKYGSKARDCIRGNLNHCEKERH